MKDVELVIKIINKGINIISNVEKIINRYKKKCDSNIFECENYYKIKILN